MPLIGRSRPPARSGPGPGGRKGGRQKNARRAGPFRAVEKAEVMKTRVGHARAVEKAEGSKTRVGRSRSGQ